MGKLLAAVLAASLAFAPVARAEDFGDWINDSVTDATPPYGSNDYLPIVQSSVTRRTKGDLFGVQRLALGWPAAIDPNKNIVATVDQASTLRSIVGTVETPVGAAATVSVYRAATGSSCAGGVALHSGSFNANGGANSNQTLAVTTTALNAGDRICLVTTGGASWTAGVGIGGITIRITTP